jgi:hypothetical protein
MADSQPYAPGTRCRCCQGWVGNGNLIEQWRPFEVAGDVLELRIDVPPSVRRCPFPVSLRARLGQNRWQNELKRNFEQRIFLK